MKFWTKTLWSSLPKKGKLPGRSALTPDGVGSVRDSASVSEMPVRTKNVSLPRIG
jgi:hypothetical protein